MIIAETINEVRTQVAEWKKEGLTVGLCPTMGYLHEGHASLMKYSNAACDKTVASVFVNPIQFGPNEDLDTYPRDFEHDCKVMEEAGVDLVFHPAVSEMYDEDRHTFVDIDVLSETLCGASREGHFRGVCTVVSKLFNIVTPDKAFFGKKDAQQLAIIRRMAKDLSFGVEIIGCPIVREEDGLAKSSRNTYLSEEERKAALILSKTIRLGQDKVAEVNGDAAALKKIMMDNLATEPLANVEYVEVVSGNDMQPCEKFAEGDLVAMAVRIGSTRLIDNFFVGDPAINI